MATNTNYYQVLGVRETASSAEIRIAYRNLIKQTHPDMLRQKTTAEQQTGGERTRILNEAYSVLHDEKRRARYDSWLRMVQSSVVSEPASPPSAQGRAEQRKQFWQAQFRQRIENLRNIVAQLQQFLSAYDSRFAEIEQMNNEVRLIVYRYGTILFSITFLFTILLMKTPFILSVTAVLTIVLWITCETLIFTWVWKSPGVSDNHSPKMLIAVSAKSVGIWIVYGLLYFSGEPMSFLFPIIAHVVAMSWFMEAVKISQPQEEIDRMEMLRYRMKQHQAEIERLNMLITSL